jgi:hypothetical protein
MEIRADIRRRLGLHDISIDLPVEGATRCGFTHLHSSRLYRLLHRRRQGCC